jgi:hypothetical protein
MKTRRSILRQFAAIPMLAGGVDFAEWGSKLGFSVLPKFRRADYETAQSPLVSWLPVKDPIAEKEEMNGFIEGIATNKLLPVLRPISIFVIQDPGRKFSSNMPEFPNSGIYLDFELIVSFLGLPRRGRKPNGTPVDRHAFSNFTESGPNDLKPNFQEACVASFDHREVKLIVENRTFKPDLQLWHSSSHSKGFVNYPGLYGANANKEEGYFRPPVPTCSRKNNSFHAVIDFIMRFDIGRPMPNRFQLVLPPVVVLEERIPLPTLFFEPYDATRKTWLE